MADFIMEFLDWFSDIWNSIVDASCEAAKAILAIVIAILTIPLWLFPFVVWLVFVKLKGGEDDG